jgi:sodium-dependent dicarboxylate transporter 2/3/5
MTSFLFSLWRRKWLFAAIGLTLLISSLPVPEGLNRDALVIIGMAMGAMIIFITEPIPLPTVALLIAIVQVVFLGYEPKKVAQSFMSDSVFFIMGSLMLAVAFVKQKLDRRMAYLLLKVTGGSTVWFAFSVLLSSAFLASLIGQHTVAAILLPVCLVVINKVEEYSGKPDPALHGLLLFSLAYGATIAGVGTPSGGARNAIMIQYFSDLPKYIGDIQPIELNYLDWMIAAYPMVIVVLPVIWLIISTLCKPDNKSLNQVMIALRSDVEKAGGLNVKDWLTISIFILTLVMWLTLSTVWGLGIVALIGATLYLVTGCVEWRDLNSGVNWGAVLLYAGAMSMGVAMVKTGAASWIATTFLTGLQAIGFGSGILLYLAVALLIAIVTNTMSSGAAVAVMAPITLQIAHQAGENIVIMGFVTVIASAFGFISVASHPGMTIVYSCGLMPATRFLKMGYKIAIASVVILVLYAITYLTLILG